jgi:Baseplate J-like protein
MADINYVPQVDYTSKDYTSIKEDMVSLIPNYLPAWTNRDSSDFGITLVELFAYMGDVLNYYIDRSANEAFLATASQRDSVLQIARLLGYSPSKAIAATVTLTFYNSTSSVITVPAKTQVATSASTTGTQIIFETDSALSVPAQVGSSKGSATVTATQGSTVYSENIGTSTGLINQVWELQKAPLIQGSISIVAGASSFTEVSYLIDYNNYDPVFATYTNATGNSFVLFGDNVSGRVPDTDAIIYATYRIGGGITGNVAAGSLKTILTNAVSGLSVSNIAAATGGADEESTDSIRANSPLSLRALNRAVSLADYSALTVSAGAAKANAVADVYTSVTVYFAPSAGDLGVTSDGVTPSDVFNTYKTTINTYLVGKVPANTTVTFQPPSYVEVAIQASVTVLSQYRQTLVNTAVNAILTELLAFDNVTFADTIRLNDITSAINSVEGVAYCQVDKLIRKTNDLTYVVTNKAASGTLATLTIGTHGLAVGDTVSISGIDTTFNGTFVVTAVGGTTISYPLISSVVSSIAATGSATKLSISDVVCAANEIPKLSATNLTLSFTGGVTN